MKRMLRFCSGVALIVGLAGCAICQGPYDNTYSAYGGRWQRLDPANNRVGSVFADAGTRVSDDGTTADTATERDIYPDLEQPPAQ